MYLVILLLLSRHSQCRNFTQVTHVGIGTHMQQLSSDKGWQDTKHWDRSRDERIYALKRNRMAQDHQIRREDAGVATNDGSRCCAVVTVGRFIAADTVSVMSRASTPPPSCVAAAATSVVGGSIVGVADSPREVMTPPPVTSPAASPADLLAHCGGARRSFVVAGCRPPPLLTSGLSTRLGHLRRRSPGQSMVRRTHSPKSVVSCLWISGLGSWISSPNNFFKQVDVVIPNVQIASFKWRSTFCGRKWHVASLLTMVMVIFRVAMRSITLSS